MLTAELDLHGRANYAEAVLWWLIAAAFALAWWRQTGVAKRQCAWAVPIFAVFGITDVIEVQTGHWARPGWLFLLKAACVGALLGLLVWHVRSGSTAPTDRGEDSDHGDD